jgi:hypothetical protein
MLRVFFKFSCVYFFWLIAYPNLLKSWALKKFLLLFYAHINTEIWSVLRHSVLNLGLHSR